MPLGLLIVVVQRHTVVASGTQEQHGRIAAIIQRAVVRQELGVHSIRVQAAGLLPSDKVRTVVVGEAPFTRHNHLLTSRELELSTTQRLLGHLLIRVLATNRQQNLTDRHAGAGALGLSECTTHTGLQAIRACAREHLVDTQNVVGMNSHTQMKRFFSCSLNHVLVARNTRSLKRLRTHVLLFPRHQVNAARERVTVEPLHSNIINADLRIRNTTAESRLGVRLVLNLAVAPRRPAPHGDWA
mmetsp:Transcript_45056/g.86160  ORF Transcript_45056/g.86160 Transcript_45056/m.86160 type:complete len:242 (-) Transcript_45056:58-783(-)